AHGPVRLVPRPGSVKEAGFARLNGIEGQSHAQRTGGTGRVPGGGRARGGGGARVWFVVAAGPAVAALPAGYRAEIEAWRTQREQRLKSEDGWLSLAALYWLKDGAHTLGTERGR